MTEVRIKSVLRGGDADQGMVDLYDGSRSLDGMARAMTLIARAYATGKAVSKAFSINGVKLFREAPRHGSFVDGIRIVFDDEVIEDVHAEHFFELVSWCFNEAIGNPVPDLQGPLLQRVKYAADELVSYIQEPLKQVHRPISSNEDMTIDIERVKGRSLVQFDRASAMRFEETTADRPLSIKGSVTRFNSLSGWGRAYFEGENRTISFLLKQNMQKTQRSRVTRSLHNYDRGEPALITFHARPVTVLGGRVKRYLVDGTGSD